MESCCSSQQESLRRVTLNSPESNKSYVNNKISNTKYNVFTFLPKNLYIQFGTFMNVYFLMIACLQLINELTPVNPITIWIPLIFIFTISAIKEAADDLKRLHSDRIANGRLYHVLQNGQKVQKKSEDILVGDLLLLQENEEIPCDVFILSCSEETGQCYIQTANLDGETVYKVRQAISFTQKLDFPDFDQLSGVIECKAPNPHIYQFDARFIFSDGKILSLDVTNSALQGTVLKSTEWAVGITVYTGDDSKFGQNKRPPPTKYTLLDRMINYVTIGIFGIMLILVTGLGVAGNLRSRDEERWYLGGSGTFLWLPSWSIIPLRFLLLFSLLIPISLKVTIDVVKYAYAQFINWDSDLYDPRLGYANATSTAIAEDLAQIQHIFTDKTGTLTENKMRVQFFHIGDQTYNVTEKHFENELGDMEEGQMFLNVLSLCHSGVPHVNKNGHSTWRCSSPDEKALIKAAAEFENVFVSRKPTEIVVNVRGIPKQFVLLDILDFSSDRRRMSVIVQSPNGEIFLLIKGADDMILRRTKEKIEQYQTQVERFSHTGLRTLIVAYKRIPSSEYQEWKSKLTKTKLELDDRDRKVAGVYEEIERDLKILGIVAIEDKLQYQVPETIQAIRDAGINVWMLTGDKMATANQIALSCNLISSFHNELLTVTETEEKSIEQCLLEHRDYLDSKRKQGAQVGDTSLIIEGRFLELILNSDSKLFLDVALRVKTVICCRVTPQQKALVVRMIKQTGVITLAIGDGGNDVAMIQEASIGVGIIGKEGQQAARASDYSIARFHFLRKLLFVHGQYSYYRTCFVGHYCFHKSFYIGLIQVLFAFYTDFSGASLFNSLSLATYNVFYTGLPVMFFVLDRHTEQSTLMNHPKLYQSSASSAFFNKTTIALWALRTVYQSLVCFFFTIVAFGDKTIHVNGDTIDQSVLAMVAFSIVVSVQTLTILIESNSLTIINLFVIFFTFLTYWGSIIVGNIIPKFNFLEVVFKMMMDVHFWLVLVLATVVSVTPIYFCKCLIFHFWPYDYQIVGRFNSSSNDYLVIDENEAEKEDLPLISVP